MTYQREEIFTGDFSNAVEIARNTFLPNGFEIVKHDDKNFEVVNNNLYTSSNQPPLQAVTKANISFQDGKIVLKAELGGIVNLIKFMVILIVAMMIIFLCIFGFGHHSKKGFNLLVIFGPFIPWPILVPVMAIIIKRRTQKALDTLLRNMVNTVR